ncbi:hypothetical protein H4R21_006789 [Coemansia helicoidea]|uniref:Uncharacterized protein n=1 Tax=Coemansia helicoidea TaxID=1286919 RepID=A0ACC1KG22_9FUNG|nr:hypothetical protein H4R21_006789 [Coemansia helicoidea]
MASQTSEDDFASSPSHDGSHTVYADRRPDAGPGFGTPSRKRARSPASAPASDGYGSASTDAADLEECIADMVARRDQLRKRFKTWAGEVGAAALQLRSVTDNALVNQSVRLERILSDGKARIDGIVGDQERIRGQLSSFVSMLSSAQSQIFGDEAGALPARPPAAKAEARVAGAARRGPAKLRAAAASESRH